MSSSSWERPDKTHFAKGAADSNRNINYPDHTRNRSIPKVSTIQDKYYVSDKKNTSHDYVDEDELEKYIKKVEKAYHSQRKREWEKAYKEQFKTKYPKDGQVDPRI